MKEFSPIQNHIISRLKNAKFLRYAEMKPENVDNDLYNYHLQQLVKKGFVQKEEEGYSLSEQGIHLVADSNLLSLDHNSHHLFKMNVLTIVSRVVNGETQILQQFRTSNPSYGKIGVPGGVVRKGETIEDAAKRKFKTETGLSADFRFVGLERRMLYREGVLFSDVVFPICYAAEYSGELEIETEYGIHSWKPIEKAIEFENEFRNDHIESLNLVFQAMQDGTIDTLTPFFKQTKQGL